MRISQGQIFISVFLCLDHGMPVNSSLAAPFQVDSIWILVEWCETSSIGHRVSSLVVRRHLSRMAALECDIKIIHVMGLCGLNISGIKKLSLAILEHSLQTTERVFSSHCTLVSCTRSVWGAFKKLSCVLTALDPQSFSHRSPSFLFPESYN